MTNGRPLIDPTSLFSAPEGAKHHAGAASPPPATNPFQAPDFGEDDTFPAEDAQVSLPGLGTARRRAS
ncbi:hypothetical protein Saso_36320 [Streptomyces asoensis]|uniref:Uncharacterized protein n=1 Tax=Streptomyces asoensis TaxID=249586 RepID=A0ABQ3S1X5_9ACTN|nr:hypothetical protein GCM10010496_43650 [Streptomyces asoensis]GHI61982.1 hypothetical protein Saso_36320 [Streptomyces asoensis]